MTDEFEAALKHQMNSEIQFRGEFIGHMKMVMRRTYDEKSISWKKNDFSCLCYIPTIMGRRRQAEEGALPGPLPDVCTGFQINEMLHPQFRSQEFDSGNFGPVPRPPIPASFSCMELDKAYPQVCIFALNPFQIVIDKRSLGDLPEPAAWEDLLDPVYQDSICINGTKYGPDLHILAWFYQRFGTKGTEALRKNIGNTMHASRMSRNIGTRKGYGICIMNRFFALACSGRPDVKLVWPLEGAVCQPLWIMVKKGKHNNYKPLLDCLLGKETGQIFADNGYISLAEEVKYRAKPEGNLVWYGWDLVMRKDFPEILQYLKNTFSGIV